VAFETDNHLLDWNWMGGCDLYVISLPTGKNSQYLDVFLKEKSEKCGKPLTLGKNLVK